MARAQSQNGGAPLPLVAAVRAPCAGFVAATTAGTAGDGTAALASSLVASVAGGPVSDAPGVVRAAVAAGSGAAVPVGRRRAHDVVLAVERWLAARAARRAAGGVGGLGGSARRRVAARLASITRRAAAHERPLLAPVVAAARRAATTACGAGAEHVLGELAAAAAMSDEAWLRAVAAFGAVHGRSGDALDPLPRAAPRVMALLLLVPAVPGDDRSGSSERR
jgi:hypothetical protein